MDVDGLATRQVVAKLADRLEEGQAFDVADRAADLDQHEVVAVGVLKDEFLDGVGDVRNDLHRCAQIAAAAFLLQNGRIDAAGRDVVGLGRRYAGEPLVVAQVQVGFGAVVGHEDLAVLIRAHRARIDVEIGVELAKTDGVTARLQECAEGCRGKAFAEGGNHAASDENVSRHGATP